MRFPLFRGFRAIYDGFLEVPVWEQGAHTREIIDHEVNRFVTLIGSNVFPLFDQRPRVLFNHKAFGEEALKVGPGIAALLVKRKVRIFGPRLCNGLEALHNVLLAVVDADV